MRLHYNKRLNLYTCDLTFEDWLNGEIIREWEDGEFLYTENGEQSNQIDPSFRRKKISERFNLWDCEEGWEERVRNQGLTRFVVTSEKELQKIRDHLEAIYWGMVDSEFKRLRYHLEEQLQAGALELRIQHELERIDFGLNPDTFSTAPVLVKHLTDRERKIFDRLPKIYADFMNNGRRCHETWEDSFRVYEHYRVDAILKYRDWLVQLTSNKHEIDLHSSNDSEEDTIFPSLRLSARAAAIFLRYMNHYIPEARSDKDREAAFLAERLCKLSNNTSGSHLRNIWLEVQATRKFQRGLLEKQINNPKFKGLKEYIKGLRSIIQHLPEGIQQQASADLEYLKTEYESLTR